jgi:DNA invertase Pin-like site-specific DNA recombinase
MKRKRVAIMARVSKKGKQDNENQLLQLRQFADRQNWDVVAEFCDEISGKSARKDRKEFDAMMLAASQKQFDLVLFWALDRLSREGTLETLQYLRTLNDYGVDWRSYTEQFIDSCGCFRDVVVSILATLAKQERIKIGDRTKAGLERARKQGRIGGRPKVTVDMGDVMHRRALGESFAEIADDLGCSQALLYKRAAEAAA